MRKLQLLALILLSSFLINAQNSYTLNVNVQGTKAQTVNLVTIVDRQQQIISTTTVGDSEKFTMTGTVEYPKMFYIVFGNKNIPFFLENSEISITGSIYDIENIKITGSESQDVLSDYKAQKNSLDLKLKMLYDEYQKVTTEYNNKNSDNTPITDKTDQDYANLKSQYEQEYKDKIEQITNDYDSISGLQTQFSIDFVKSHNNSYASPYIVVNELIFSLDYEQLKEITQTMDTSLNKSSLMQYLNDRVETLGKVAIGNKYTDFSQNDPDGNPVSPSQFEGTVLLIDFWASWCRPCRSANPYVVEIYKEFHDQGFNILGVSFDENRDKWLQAIKDDNLTWTHVSDLKGWSNAAGKLYGVMSIPHTVLIDKSGKIVAKNLSHEELKEMVAKLVKE